jgi:predicted pyridoxine 5'-phosphate oxidase superfamily flavin-nucleotide-binding protein
LHHSDEALVEHLFKGRDTAINLIDTLPLASLSTASKTRIISPPNVAAMYYLQDHSRQEFSLK